MVKVYVILQPETISGTPKELQLLRIGGVTLIFFSIILINIKPKLSKIFVSLVLVYGFIQSFWDYTLGEMSILHLLFLIFCFSFLSLIL